MRMMNADLYDGNKNAVDAEHPLTLPNSHVVGAISKTVEEYDKMLKRGSPANPNDVTGVAAAAATTTANQNGTSSPRDTPSEPIDVTTIPNGTDAANDLTICLSVNNKSPTANLMSDVVMNHQGMNGYTREVQPPNSIYGIENMQTKQYEQDVKVAPDMANIQSPRYSSAHALTSPHHSTSPDKESSRHTGAAGGGAGGANGGAVGAAGVKHENNAPWISPVKSHNYRNPTPLTSPYIESRDPNYPRRYLPPFYGANRTFAAHVANDRSRYGTYPLGSPLMSTLGFSRDTLDSRYNLHVNPTLGGFEDQKFKLSPPSIDDKHIWTKQEVELLLDLYEEHKTKLQDPRVRKTKVWDDIAKQIHEKLDADVNGCQCNQKFRNMKADYQKVVEHNTRSDSFRKTCKYFERLEKLLTPVSDPGDKMKMDVEGEKFFNGFGVGGQNGQATTPNGNGYYEHQLSHSSSPDSSENPQNYENETGSSNTPSSPEKRPLAHIETASDDASPPPSKRPCTDCNCGGISKRDLIDILKEFLKEQRKREEETIRKIQMLHREKIDTVVKFLDLFQELVKKV